MPVIVSDGSAPRVVVVSDATSVGVVTARSSAVSVPGQGVSLGTVTEQTSVVQVASTGIQGRAGAPGSTSEPRIAAEILGGHRIVRATGGDAVGYASSDNPLHGDDTVGLTLGAALAGATVDVQQRGRVVHAGWNWTPGEPVFLGRGGLPTQTPADPDAGDYFHQEIGFAEDATSLQIAIDSPIYF